MSYLDGVVEGIRKLEAERTEYKKRLDKIHFLLREPKKACEARASFGWDSQYPLSKYKELVYSLLEVLESSELS